MKTRPEARPTRTDSSVLRTDSVAAPHVVAVVVFFFFFFLAVVVHALPPAIVPVSSKPTARGATPPSRPRERQALHVSRNVVTL